MKTIKKLFLIIIVIMDFSCSKEGNSNFRKESISLEKVGETSKLNAFEIENEIELKEREVTSEKQLKIIKNANCKIKVSSVELITILAKKIAKDNKGYISDERFTNTNYLKENRFTIRVPQQNFDKTLDSICKLAEFVDHKNITTIDVTEEYMDITSRLKTKKEVKKRYEDILKGRAKNVEDLLLTEEKLKEIQEEIEVAQGRLNYLSNKVTYSTIQFDVYENVVPKEEPIVYSPGFLDKAEEGIVFGWSVLEYLVLIVFYIWPLIVLGILSIIYFNWFKK